MNKLILIRHGATDRNLHLNEEGKKQCIALRQKLLDLPIEVIYCSPVERTVETSQLLFPDKEIVFDARLTPEGRIETLYSELKEIPVEIGVVITHLPTIQRFLELNGQQEIEIPLAACLSIEIKN